MIHRAVHEADLDDTAASVIEQLAGAATIAVGLTKRCLNRALETGLTDAMENESVALELSSRTSDFREGLAAFTGRRPPVFEGR
jgi:2-(1,2-epoxy-1,2-dihydrophenyl)acetyl-CoA isomerase